MRLIDTRTGELKEYTGSYIPDYVTLSHRWSDDEITFKDYTKARRTSSLGYKKILQFCEVARSRGVGHAWVDTACIDKRSSSELSEAINSMYQWYAKSVECYAYLADVSDASEISFQQLRSSEWFMRGWTLQELVAPRLVRFFTRSWTEIGGCGHGWRPYKAITNLISNITSIPAEILQDNALVPNRSLAERMSWLRDRTTTREEDKAYCAMGLLGVNMPLLYGEGSRAWQRLQEEIIRTSYDESIFTWTSTATPPWGPYDRTAILAPILAHSASFFVDGTVRRSKEKIPRPPYAVTHQGLELRLKAGTAHRIALPLETSTGPVERNTLIITLQCCHREEGHRTGHLVLFLLAQPCGHFDRILPSNTYTIAELARDSPDMLQHNETVYVHTTHDMQYRCHLDFSNGHSRSMYLKDVDFDRMIERASVGEVGSRYT